MSGRSRDYCFIMSSFAYRPYFYFKLLCLKLVQHFQPFASAFKLTLENCFFILPLHGDFPMSKMTFLLCSLQKKAYEIVVKVDSSTCSHFAADPKYAFITIKLS